MAKLKTISLNELFERETKEVDTGCWGKDGDSLVHTRHDCPHNSIDYDIPLDECSTSAQALDWIFQWYGKVWCTPECMYNLLTIIEHTIHPQARLCSMGRECGEGAKE